VVPKTSNFEPVKFYSTYMAYLVEFVLLRDNEIS